MANEQAVRIDELRLMGERIVQLITVDFSGPYDDRRPLEEMQHYLNDRRVALEEEAMSGNP